MDIQQLIIGNIFGGLCGLCCSISALQKTRKQAMLFQSMDCTFGLISSIILKGYSGAITQAIALIINIIVYKEKITNRIQIASTIVLLIAGILGNNRGILGMLPIVASVSYKMVIMKTDSIQWLRMALIINNIMWAAYEIVIKNYISCLFSTIIIIVTVISFVINLKNNNAKAN